ncbi:hypothetical protein [Oceanibium sediminis]|uniref:hypothetical protein n=1 Tax=Oceanibium sediminis TaxID=2026339 RepID=UPI0013008072|nr:hypothetical protein [Oceanibium sediminis]
MLRYSDFDERFDDSTLFFDLFRTEDPLVWEASCPPALNLAEDYSWEVIAEPSGQRIDPERIPRIMHDLLRFRVPEGSEALRLRIAGVAEQSIVPQPSVREDFAGRKVVFTLSKDNDLAWIRDWAQYYVRVHGADTAVIYDNDSTRTTRAQIAEALAGVEGLEAFAVIDWPFRYGPNDHRRPGTLYLAESDYCQRGMFEHARRRLFPEAAMVINADVDELIYSESGARLCDVLAEAPAGYVEALGLWVEAVSDGRTDAVRHVAFAQRDTSERFPTMCEPKWALVPAKLPADAQWTAHRVIGAAPMAESADFAFGHFRAINTDWDLHVSNNTTTRRTDSPEEDAPLSEIPALRRAMDAAFPSPDAGWIETPVQEDADDAFQQTAHCRMEPRDPAAAEARGGPHYWVHRSHLASLDPAQAEVAAQFSERALRGAKGAQLYFVLSVVAMRYDGVGRPEQAAPLIRRYRAGVGAAYQAACDALLAWCLRDSKPEAAMAHMAAAIAVHPDRAGYHLFIAERLKVSDPAGARRAFEAAIAASKAPGCLASEVAVLGAQCAHIGRCHAAEYLGLEVHKDVVMWSQYAAFLRQTGSMEEVLDATRMSLLGRPTNSERQLALASLYREMGQDEHAAHHEACALSLARVQYAHGTHHNAQPYERQMHRARATVALIKALHANGLQEEMDALLAKDFHAVAGLEAPRRRLASFLMQHDKLEQADAFLGRVLKRAPADPVLLRFRMLALLRLKRFDAAAAAAIALGKVAPVPPHIVNRLVNGLHPDRDCSRIRALYALLFASTVGDASPELLEKAVAYEADRGDAVQAVDWAQQMEAAHPAAAESHLARARARSAAGARGLARLDFQRALEVNPGLLAARKGLDALKKAAP